jgi:hypothetical protein
MNVEHIIFNKLFTCDHDLNVEKEIINILQHCNILAKNFIYEQNSDMATKILFEIMYILNYLYKSIGLLKTLFGNEVKNINKYDLLIETYHNNFFSTEKLFMSVTNLKNKTITKQKKNIIEKIEKRFIDLNNDKPTKYLKKINTLTDKLNISLNCVVIINDQKIITSLSKYIDNIPDELYLNKDNYYFIQNRIKDPMLRCEIEKIYYKNNINNLKILEKIIVTRHEYAVSLGSKSYFDFIKDNKSGSSDEIKLLMNNLIEKINERSSKEIQRFKKELMEDGHNKKVNTYDMIYYHNKLKSKCKFPLDVIINTLFLCIKNMFGVSFIKTGQHKLWTNIDVYEVTNSKNDIIGNLYLDVKCSKNKKTTSPVCIHLCHKYKHLDETISPTKIMIVAGYEKNNPSLVYSDIVFLFREFGTALQCMSHDSKYGVYIEDKEFNVLFPQIMEYIAWEKSTINMICNNDDKIVEHILFTRYIDFAHNIKLKCTNALFDHILHNSSEFINILTNNTDDSENIIKNLYDQVCTTVFNSQNNNLNTNGINPTNIIQEINGSEGILYTDMLTEILSYGVYTLIKKGKGEYFINNVLGKKNGDMRSNIRVFLSTLDSDSYYLYLQEIIGYNEIDTEINKNIKYSNIDQILTETPFNCFYDDTDGSNNTDVSINTKKVIN